MNTSSIVRMQERLNQLWGPRRRLPGDVLYLLPSDSCEYERSCFEHYALKVAFGRNVFAPLVHPVSILDVGCGLGTWAFDLCRIFPHARVVGFDIVATNLANPPPNYRFVQGSLLQPLPFADNSFDYVHQRLMWISIPAQGWRSILSELLRVTAPGGYLELVEIAPGLETMGPVTAQIVGWINETGQRCGIDPNLMLHLPTMLDLAGAVTFSQRVLWLPVGAVQGHGGRLMEQTTSAFFASMAPSVCEHLALPFARYQQAWNDMREEWTQRRILCPFVVTLAQKPLLGLRSHTLLSLDAPSLTPW